MIDAVHRLFPLPDEDLERPNVARVYDWYLGGQVNWAVDRDFGRRVLDSFPLVRPIAIANRLVLRRIVRYLAQHGVRQFVDIGSGVPTRDNTHSVADEIAPGSRVVYVDNESTAVAHSKVLLEMHGHPGRHAVIYADLRHPDVLWQRVVQTGVINLTEPVALLLIAVLHFHQPGPDGRDVSAEALCRYRELLPSGSYLAISHITDHGVPDHLQRKLAELKGMYDSSADHSTIWRSKDEIRELFGDFQLIDPGLCWTPQWHPEETRQRSRGITFRSPNESVIRAGVGRKS